MEGSQSAISSPQLRNSTWVMVFLKGIAYGSGILVEFLMVSRVIFLDTRLVRLAYLADIASLVQYESCRLPAECLSTSGFSLR